MVRYQHKKVGISCWNYLLWRSLKITLSRYGIAMFILALTIGGGGVSLIMAQVSMSEVGFYIVQPAILSIYFMMIINRLNTLNSKLFIRKEVLNLLITVAVGFLLTIILLCLLSGVNDYIMPVSQATISTPSAYFQPTQPAPAVYQKLTTASYISKSFNMYSIATFLIYLFLPMFAMFLAALAHCDGPIIKNMKTIMAAIFSNIGMMVAISLTGWLLMACWSYLALQNIWLVYTSCIPLTFLVSLIYCFTEKALTRNAPINM